MGRQTDFLWLYQQLGLNPNCSPVQLRDAYRRRVAEWHPDRRRDGDDGDTRLKDLTVIYNEALGFARRHGRLPGASQRVDPNPVSASARMHVTAPARCGARVAGAHGVTTLAASEPSHRLGLRITLVGAFALAALAWLTWDHAPIDPAASDAIAPRTWIATGSLPRAAPTAPSGELLLGMDTAAVARLEGKPLMATDERWDYGPSWIEFDRGVVSDWYNSRLRPLKSTFTRPARDAKPPAN